MTAEEALMSILRFRHFSHPLKTNTHINQINPLYRPALYLVHENFACIACTGTPQKASFYTLAHAQTRDILTVCVDAVCVCVCVCGGGGWLGAGWRMEDESVWHD